MTPDKVVKVLELILPKDKEFWIQVIPEISLTDKPGDPNKISHIFEIKRALRTARTLIQDYQKLREKIRGDELGLKIFIKLSGLPYEQATDFWTSKHCQNSIKKVSAELAEETIPGYLL